MKTFQFHLDNEDNLIQVDAQIGKADFSLALDTGATHTVIDLTIMLMNGYTLKEVIRTVEFETAKGNLTAYVFMVKELQVLGKTRTNMEISSYDFMANNVIFDIDGVLGLDFFKGTNLNINFETFEITLK